MFNMADTVITQIYALRDPRDGSVRYIGKTIQTLDKRLRAHVRDAKHAHKHRSLADRDRWIAGLLTEGLSPSIEWVETVEGPGWAAAEMHWIKHFRAFGQGMTNATDGGEGCTGWKPSEEFRLAGSIRLKKRLSDPVERAKFADASKASLSTPEARAARGERTAGLWAMPELRSKLQASMTAAWADPEKKASRRAAMAAAWTPERRANLAEKMRLRCSPAGDQPQLKQGPISLEKIAMLASISDAAWADPTKRAARIEKIRAAQIAHQAKRRTANEFDLRSPSGPIL